MHNDLNQEIQRIMDETGLDEVTATKIASGQSAMVPPDRPLARIGPRDLSTRPDADARPDPAISITTTTDPECPDCGGIGWYKKPVTVYHADFGKLFPCTCTQARQAQHLAERRTGILGRLDHELGSLAACRFETYDPGTHASLLEALDTAQRYAAAPRNWLYLYGSCGTGKSHLAAAIAHAVAERGIRVSYASAPSVLRFIKSGFRDDTSDERLIALQFVDLLILDDIGAEHHSEYNDSALFEVINHRYLYDRLTVFTSNMKSEDLEPRIGSRIAGRAERLKMVAPDYRRRGPP